MSHEQLPYSNFEIVPPFENFLHHKKKWFMKKKSTFADFGTSAADIIKFLVAGHQYMRVCACVRACVSLLGGSRDI